MQLHLHFPSVTSIDLGDLFGARRLIRKIFCNTERLIAMSGTLAEQLTQFQADTATALDGVTSNLTDIAADVDGLLAGQGAGTTITQAMVDNQAALRDRVVAARDALQAINDKVPPVATP